MNNYCVNFRYTYNHSLFSISANLLQNLKKCCIYLCSGIEKGGQGTSCIVLRLLVPDLVETVVVKNLAGFNDNCNLVWISAKFISKFKKFCEMYRAVHQRHRALKSRWAGFRQKKLWVVKISILTLYFFQVGISFSPKFCSFVRNCLTRRRFLDNFLIAHNLG